MRHQKKFWLPSAALAATLLSSQAAHAQFDLSRLSARVSVTTIIPDVKSDDLSAPSLAGTKVDIKSATQLTGGLNYRLADNWAIDVPLGLPFKHDVVGDGAIAGTGKLGDVKSLPITALLQYRFGQTGSKLRPYLGGGVTYARFFKAKGTAVLSGLTGGSPSNPTTLSMDNAVGATAQLGLAIAINNKWSVDLSAIYVKLKTTGKLSTGQTIDTRLDPTALTVGLAYQF